MDAPAHPPFPPDALEANRRGELSDAQRRGFGALSREQRRNDLSIAGFLVAGALVVIFFASPTASPLMRMLLPVLCFAIAAFLVARSVTGGKLAGDLRRGQVQSVEGAIGRRRISSGGSRAATSYFLEVGDARFKVSSGPFQAAPDAGFVRLYFLPHSRKVVNLERLPNAPLPMDLTPKTVLASLAATLLAPDRRQRNEARAGVAGMGEALEATFSTTPPVAPQERDPRPLREVIVGTWTNGMMKVTFSPDGRVTTDVFGAERTGRWSVDADGRLNADIRGREEAADAWVAGNQLTIATSEGGLTLTRDSSA